METRKHNINNKPMKYIKLLSTALITAFAFGAPMSMNAAEKKAAPEKAPATEAPKAAAKEEASKPLPFHGVVGAVDKAAKTFTITRKSGDKVFAVTADTKITKKDAPATFDDIAAQAYVTGSYVKTGDKLTAHSLKLGEEKPVKAGKKEAEKPADKPADKAPAKTK